MTPNDHYQDTSVFDLDAEQDAANNTEPENEQGYLDAEQVKYLSLDLTVALDELNRDRDVMYGETSSQPIQAELNNQTIQEYIHKYGVTGFWGLVKKGLTQAGYIQQNEVAFMHKKSGVLIKL